MAENKESQQRLIQIDLSGIIRSRLGSRGRFIPSFLLKALERLICQRELNEMMKVAYPKLGSEFSASILNHLDLSVEVRGLDKLPAGESFEFVSNHPLGGLDGIALVGVLGGKYGDCNLRVVVNDLLLHIEPLKDVFVPVNKFGSQGREGVKAINEAFTNGKQVLMFPAGLVSRLHPDGSIRDLTWQKMCVAKALEYQRRIVPIRFEGLNSMRFYRAAYWRKRLGIKVNLEQALLPSELVKSRGKQFKILVGSPIDIAEMKREGRSIKEILDVVRGASDSLKLE